MKIMKHLLLISLTVKIPNIPDDKILQISYQSKTLPGFKNKERYSQKNIAINVIKMIITDFFKYIGEIVLIKLKSSNVANKSLK